MEPLLLSLSEIMISLILLSGLASLLTLKMPVIAAELSTLLQNKCADIFASEELHRNLSQSFVCGTPLGNSFDQILFQETGLIHFMVVSGCHLHLLSALILAPWPQRFRVHPGLKICLLLILLLYCLMTGFRPPVVRVFVCFLIRELSENFKWNWDASKVHLASGVLILGLAPDWIFNFSFYLSWLASTGFLLAPLCLTYHRKTKHWREFAKHWLNSLTVQSLMSVGLLEFSFLSVFLNAIFAPLVAFFIFPMTLLLMAFPSFAHLADFFWEMVLSALRFFLRFPHPDHLPLQNLDFEKWFLLWIFLALLQVAFEILRRYRYQRHYV